MRFLADVMLGKLARWLRVLGHDTAYDRNATDQELIRRALAEDRWLLTRDGYLAQRKVLRGRRSLLTSDGLDDQLRQLGQELAIPLWVGAETFSRCPDCNRVLKAISASQAAPHVPPFVAARHHLFVQCPGCGRVYWPGPHWTALLAKLARLRTPCHVNNAGWHHLLLTGRPGVGKTTLVRALVSRLMAFRPAGFYTEEIREQGTRRGFRLVTLDGRTLVLAHTSHRGPRVGRYGVDIPGFERLLAALDLRHAAARLVVVDEIGKMECLSRRFVEEIEAVLDGPAPLLATVAQKGEGFISSVKRRPDCRLVTVTIENRDRLTEGLGTDLEKVLRG
ncbi:nucleoside-triphosphatase [Nitrospira sp. Kam-Ns4a]